MSVDLKSVVKVDVEAEAEVKDNVEDKVEDQAVGVPEVKGPDSNTCWKKWKKPKDLKLVSVSNHVLVLCSS